MKILTTAQLDALADKATMLATLWQIARRDGVVVRLTDCDTAVVAAGQTYAPTGAMERSAVRLRTGTAIDNADCSGLFGQSVTKSDVLNGRYDGARVSVMIGFVNVDLPPIPISAGIIGEVTVDGEQYTLEVNGLTQLLQSNVVEVTSPTCRAQFGDSRCAVNLASWRHTYTVASVSGDDQITMVGPSQLPVTATYANGLLEVLSGAAAGLTTEIRSWSGLTATLYVAPLTLPSAGDSVRLTAGCNKSRTTCKDVFDNLINFQGEPDVPGLDLLASPPVR